MSFEVGRTGKIWTGNPNSLIADAVLVPIAAMVFESTDAGGTKARKFFTLEGLKNETTSKDSFSIVSRINWASASVGTAVLYTVTSSTLAPCD
jgi:hypothetical protein